MFLTRNVIILAAIVGLGSCSDKPVSSNDQLVRVSYQSTLDDQEKDFFLYLPKGYGDQPEKKWPVLMFLHGDGERGNSKDELDYVLIHGPLYEAWAQKRELPFVMISPQLPMFGRDTPERSYLVDRNPDWIPRRQTEGAPERGEVSKPSFPMAGAAPVQADSMFRLGPPNGWEKVEEDLVAILDQVLSDYKVDPDRVYLSGLSYGGFGTWYMASKHPELFAAINPIVGWGHPDLMDPIAQANLPVWVFSGGRDPVVQKKYFLPGLNKLEELGHTNLHYTIHEDLGHNVWTRVYKGEDIYDWFLSHSRNSIGNETISNE